MTSKEYLDAVKEMGLTPIPGLETEGNWIMQDREGHRHGVHKPYRLAPEQRRAALERLRRRVLPPGGSD